APRAVVDHPELPRVGMERSGLEVAMSVGVNLGEGGRLFEKGVVTRHGAVGTDANDLPEGAVEPLRLGPPLEDRSLTRRHEQRPVARENEAGAEVLRRVQRGAHAPDDLDALEPRGRGVRNETAARDSGAIAALARLRIGPVDELVLREAGIERDIEQAALIPGVRARQALDGVRLRAVRRDEAHAPGALGHEEPVLGQERGPPRVPEAVRDALDRERDVLRAVRGARLTGERGL